MAAARRDHPQCPDRSQAAGITGRVFVGTAEAAAFSVSQPGGPSVASCTHDAPAAGCPVSADWRHGSSVSSLAHPRIADPQPQKTQVGAALKAAALFAKVSDSAPRRWRSPKTNYQVILASSFSKFRCTCAGSGRLADLTD